MARDIQALTVTASQQPTVYPVLMVDLDFTSGPFRAHTGVGTFSYDGNDYTGLGYLGKITSIEEDVEMGSSGINLILSGIPTSIVSIALGTHYQGRTGIVYIALLDEDHGIQGEPVIIFQGRMDNMNIVMGSKAEIELSIENVIRDWDRPRVRRYNNVDQQSIYPDDKGFEFVAQAAAKELFWGGKSPE